MEASSNPEIPETSAWTGCIRLRFNYRNNKTYVIPQQVRAPLKVQRPFYPEGPEVCHSVILHTAGGMVGGDRLDWQLQLDTQARALITTAAAGKIYRSNGSAAQQTMKIHVAAGACLEWLPQETIVFDGAVYQQDLRVELAPGASWLGWEITRFGRTARAEQFLQGSWRSRTEVWQQGRPLWIDPQSLQGGTAMLNSPHGLAGYPVVGTLVCIGPALPPDLVAKARLLWSTNSLGEAGSTHLPQGVLCRYRGPSSWEVRNWFTRVWHLLRFSLLGRSACRPPVWL